MSRENIRQEIISKIVRIPDENLDSIKDYIDYVIEKGKKKRDPSAKSKRSKVTNKKAKSVLVKSFGMADVKPFAHKIDEILYGMES